MVKGTQVHAARRFPKLPKRPQKKNPKGDAAFRASDGAPTVAPVGGLSE